MTIHHLYISTTSGIFLRSFTISNILISFASHLPHPSNESCIYDFQRFPFLVVVLVRRTVDPIAAPRPPLAAAIRVDTRDFIKGSRSHVISRIVQGTKGERRCYTRDPISLRIREEESRRKSIETTLRDGFFQLYIPNIRRTNGAMIN